MLPRNSFIIWYLCYVYMRRSQKCRLAKLTSLKIKLSDVFLLFWNAAAAFSRFFLERGSSIFFYVNFHIYYLEHSGSYWIFNGKAIKVKNLNKINRNTKNYHVYKIRYFQRVEILLFKCLDFYKYVTYPCI